MSEIELREIGHSFGQKTILDRLNLRIESGQYVVLLGASGCGKTTTLRLIAGLQKPTSGSILIAGQCVDHVAPRNRDVTMVFQNDALYPHLTVRGSIAFALRRRGGRSNLSKGEVSKRIEEAADLAGAAEILDRYPDRLSGGELRRAAIAKAIARRGSVRLMDEPLSALDAPLRHSLQEDLLRWHRSIEGTTLHVTHDGQEAMRMADQIAVMDEGRIVQYGTPQEIYHRPQFRCVALAIGSPPIHFFAQTWNNESIQPTGGLKLATDGSIEVGVRGESLTLLQKDQAVDRPSLVMTAVIERITAVDGTWHAHARVGGEHLIAVMPGPGKLQVGQQCRFSAAAEQLHVFAAGSGQRIDVESAV